MSGECFWRSAPVLGRSNRRTTSGVDYLRAFSFSTLLRPRTGALRARSFRSSHALSNATGGETP